MSDKVNVDELAKKGIKEAKKFMKEKGVKLTNTDNQMIKFGIYVGINTVLEEVKEFTEKNQGFAE